MDVASIKEYLGLYDDDKATAIAELVNGEREIDKYDIPDEFPGTQAWVRQCHNYPSQGELVRSCLNDILGGFGIEAINNPDDSSETIGLYVNQGDTYAATIVYDVENDQYILTSWGDFYSGWIDEQNEENDTVQCGYCSHLTPIQDCPETGEPDWHSTTCESCGNCVSG